jgi:hypothetical protein
MQSSWGMPSIYIFPRSVYRIDVNNRRVVPIDSLTGPGRIRGATALNIHYEGRETRIQSLQLSLEIKCASSRAMAKRCSQLPGISGPRAMGMLLSQ